jgi:hypothetical protein
LLAEGVGGVASLAWDKVRGAHDFAVNTFGSIVYDLGQRTGWGGESFQSQYEATADVVVPLREVAPRMTPAETLYRLYEGNLERKQRYDEAFERGDIKAAQAEAIPTLEQLLGVRALTAPLTGTPGMAMALAPEGATVMVGEGLATSPTGLGAGILLSGNTRGNEATTVQENTPSRDDSAPTRQVLTRDGPGPNASSAAPGVEPLKEGDVMSYREYLARRTRGSTLRGHHTPQAARLEELGIDPLDGTIVVIENKLTGSAGEPIGHTGTRTHGTRGARAAAAEKGRPLSFSETRDLLDPPVERLGPEVGEMVQALNRVRFPDRY